MTPNTPSNFVVAWMCAVLVWIFGVYGWLRRAVREIWQIVYLVRFSVVLALILVVFCVLPEQSRESFRKLSEDVGETPGRVFWLLVGLFSFVLVSWYWSRTSINLLAPSTMKAGGLRGWCARNLPRLAAILPLLGTALAGAISASWDWQTYPFLAGVVVLLLAAAAYLFFFLRRRYLNRHEPPAATADAAPKGFRELPRLGKIILWASLAVSIALIILFSSTPAFAWNFGSPAILMFWATTMVSIGSLLAILGARCKFPFIGALVVLGIVFSWLNLNDNHEIRPPKRAATALPPDFGAAFEDWLKNRGDISEYSGGREYPVFIVAAQGGGIRAAYETAIVLGRLQDICPSFAQHVFAISGVSGGSLGAGVFAGLAEQKAKNAPRQPCDPAARSPFQDAADRVLREDLLSPPLAAALYPDLLQRMLPVPIGAFDRARGLETGFEQAWRSGTEGGDEFAGNFHDLADNFASEATPALFLNTTNVASGLRMVVAHLYPSNHGFGDLFVTEQDVKAGIDMPLSTAMGLSARFPVVTPAGTITGEKKARFVDGGYYENSGTVTVQSMLSYFLRQRAGGLQSVRFVVITIGTDACVDERSAAEAEDCRNSISPIFTRAATGLGEVLSPLRAILNTRGGRGLGAVDDLIQLSAALSHQATLANPATRGGFDVIPVEITRHDVAIPLGWEISAAARKAVRDQIDMPGDCPRVEPPAGKVVNSRSLGCIVALLEGRL